MGRSRHLHAVPGGRLSLGIVIKTAPKLPRIKTSINKGPYETTSLGLSSILSNLDFPVSFYSNTQRDRWIPASMAAVLGGLFLVQTLKS
jgi:hypothetical protein